MPDPVDVQLTSLTAALQSAHVAGLGVPPDLQPVVRSYARAFRLAGGDIGSLLVAVKALVRNTTGNDEPLFTPKIVGWAIAGFFAGTAPKTR